MTPEIVTYGPSADAPPHMAYAASMVPTGKAGSYWVAVGPTADAARAKLEAIWLKQYPPTDRRRSSKKPTPEAEPLDVVI